MLNSGCFMLHSGYFMFTSGCFMFFPANINSVMILIETHTQIEAPGFILNFKVHFISFILAPEACKNIEY